MNNDEECIIVTIKMNINVHLPRHVRKLIAEWLQMGIGVTKRRYADPLKYASLDSEIAAVAARKPERKETN